MRVEVVQRSLGIWDLTFLLMISMQYKQKQGISCSFSKGEISIILKYNNIENSKIDESIRSAFVILGEAAGDVMEAIGGESKQLL
jgi:hypothetical protein